MDIGVALPLPADDLGTDPRALEDLIGAVAGARFDHLSVHDHVVGSDPRQVPNPAVRYSHRSIFHEPLILLAWAAARAPAIGLITTVVVAPQRQIVLLAKQAAELAVLSRNRLTLGLGVGVNPYEYEALGVDFARRGRRFDEQLPLLRTLLSGATVTADGAGAAIRSSAVSPAPSAPVPIWVGGTSPAALRRAVTFADGLVLMTSEQEPTSIIRATREELDRSGRNISAFSFHGFVEVVTGGPGQWRRRVDDAQRAGMTSVSLMTGHPMLPRLPGGRPETHADRITDAARALGRI